MTIFFFRKKEKQNAIYSKKVNVYSIHQEAVSVLQLILQKFM